MNVVSTSKTSVYIKNTSLHQKHQSTSKTPVFIKNTSLHQKHQSSWKAPVFKRSLEWTYYLPISNHNNQPNVCEKHAALFCNRFFGQRNFSCLPFSLCDTEKFVFSFLWYWEACVYLMTFRKYISIFKQYVEQQSLIIVIIPKFVKSMPIGFVLSPCINRIEIAHFLYSV